MGETATRRGGVRRYLLVVLVAGAIALWRAGPATVSTLTAPPSSASWHGSDLDTGLIMRGLSRAPHWQDTFRWFVGPWAGEVPFYRPLTSYVFWVEWKLFGEDERLYALPALAFHVLATALFAVLIRALAVRHGLPPELTACLGAALFTGGLLPEFRLGVLSVPMYWKNQPDALAAACIFLALLAYLRAAEQGRALPTAALVWFVLGCGFKESVVTAPLLAPALEYEVARGRFSGHWLARILAWFAALACFLVVRQLALGGVGYTYGSNDAWLSRGFVHLLGPFSPLLIGGWASISAALWARAVVECARRGRLTRSRLAVGIGAVLLGWTAIGATSSLLSSGLSLGELLTPEGLLSAPLSLFIGPGFQMILHASLYLAALSTLQRGYLPILVLGGGWLLAFLLVLSFSPGPWHRYYLPDAGHSLVLACGGAAWLRRLMQRGRARGQADADEPQHQRLQPQP